MLSPKSFKGTRSEFNFPINNKLRGDWDLQKGKQDVHSIYQNNVSPGFNFKKNPLPVSHTMIGVEHGNRDKLIEGEVYK